ncbi:MAG: L-threonylcarbamoyladenylate synthase [Woeseiaceae bacterium]
MSQDPIAQAVDILRKGGVITCPTEGVFGLSCLPDNAGAVQRLLDIKQRDVAKGLILIAASKDQLRDWVAVATDDIPDPKPDLAITWIVPASENVSALVRGEHAGIAVRITSNPVARELCAAAESPLVSTSANLAGEPTVTDRAALSREFAGRVDYIVPGECGPLSGPSEIIDLESGRKLR